MGRLRDAVLSLGHKGESIESFTYIAFGTIESC